jgi:amino acid transporter
MIDYVLTAAVSLTAGVEAIASAIPALWPYRMQAALFLLLLITLINLRGLQEAGTTIAVPVYAFLSIYISMLVFGFFRAFTEGPGSFTRTAPSPVEALTPFLVLHAFASGSTALTGIEAISNGVPAFKPPESHNAGRTLIVMAFLMGFMFVGSIGLTQYFGVVAGPEETILSALAHRLVGNGLIYYIVQTATLLILAVAANTSFADFPRLASIMARDGFLPRQLYNLGDRLVFSNGMLLLAGTTALLVIVFGGDSHSLVPLFAVGAFLAFTMSQSGMVVHWLRQKGREWRTKSIINGIGAVTTAIMLVVVAASKFVHGAWFTLILIPSLVFIFMKIKSHYAEVAKELTLHGLPPSLRPSPPLRLVIPISGMHRAVIEAVNYARSISENVTALYVEVDPSSCEKIQAKWKEWFPDLPLVCISSPYRSIVGPLLEYLDRYDAETNDGQLAAVVLPEIIPAKTWQAFLHNQSALLIKTALLYRRRTHGFQRVVIDVPFHLNK